MKRNVMGCMQGGFKTLDKQQLSNKFQRVIFQGMLSLGVFFWGVMPITSSAQDIGDILPNINFTYFFEDDSTPVQQVISPYVSVDCSTSKPYIPGGAPNMPSPLEPPCSPDLTGEQEFIIQIRNMQRPGNFSENDPVLFSRSFNLNTLQTGGESFLSQTSAKFSANSNNYIVNYGITFYTPVDGSSAVEAFSSYAAVGTDKSTWMSDLTSQSDFSDITFGDLVIPGSHDAGMYMLGDPETTVNIIQQICGNIVRNPDDPLNLLMCTAVKFVSEGLLTIIQNVALTQKEPIAAQLENGVRFLDLRPAAYTPDPDDFYHVHDFVQGAHLIDILKDVNGFLANKSGEMVVIQVSDQGLDYDYFDYITEPNLSQLLTQYLPNANPCVFNVTTTAIPCSYGSYFALNDTQLTKVAAENQVIVIYFNSMEKQSSVNINDSYEGNSSDYSESSVDTSGVQSAVTEALENCQNSEYRYTILQIQDTNSAVLANASVLDDNMIVDVLNTPVGSAVQGTKPTFDQGLMFYLIAKEGSQLSDCKGPVVILNDFVDVGMSSVSIKSSQTRYNNRQQ